MNTIKNIITKEIALVAVVVIVVGLFIGSRIVTDERGKLIANLGGPAGSAVPPETPAPSSSEFIKVLRVIDGDTIELEGGERLRYIGIDAPEGAWPGKSRECYSLESAGKNKELVEGKLIQFDRDVTERDIYGRLLGYVYVDGAMVNEQLVKMGAAFSASYPPDIKHQTLFDSAEKKAMEQGQGIWNACGYSAENRPKPD